MAGVEGQGPFLPAALYQVSKKGGGGAPPVAVSRSNASLPPPPSLPHKKNKLEQKV